MIIIPRRAQYVINTSTIMKVAITQHFKPQISKRPTTKTYQVSGKF